MRTHITDLGGLIGFFFLISTSLLAQEINLPEETKHRVGFISGVGDQSFGGVELDVRYDYDVTFYQFQYYRLLFGNDNWDVDLLIQPQYNTSRFRPVDDIPDKVDGFEFGVNVGVLIRKNIISDFLAAYVLISLGPHYVSGVPERQADGFIFSDNVFVGVNLKLSDKAYLDLRPGFRHVSNANLTKPNQGVNNIILSGGILVDL